MRSCRDGDRRNTLRLPAEPEPQSADDWLRQWLGIDSTRCPCCGDVLLCEALPPQTSVTPPPRRATTFEPWDTS